MPTAERGAAMVPGHRLGHIGAGDSLSCATQPKLDVLEVGFESFIEQAYLAEDFGANDERGPGRQSDVAGGLEGRCIGTPLSHAPSGSAAGNRIKGAIQLVA